MAEDKGKTSVSEAGRKGGEATSATHDREFYPEIGSKGGRKSAGNFASDREKASKVGRKGARRSPGNG